MRGRVAKSRRTRHPRLKPLKPSQKKLLDAVVAGEGIGIDLSGELPPGHSKQSLLGGDPTQETTAHTRQPGTASDIRSSPARRLRSTRTDLQRPRVEDKKAGSENPGMTPLAHTSRQLMEGLVQPTRRARKLKPPKCRDTSLPEPKVERQEQASLATWLRKQQIDSDDGGNEPELKRARLTERNLARFNKMERKKGYTKTSHNDSTSESTTKTMSARSSGFAIRAHMNGILDPFNSKPPTNLENIQEQHARSRATASPAELRFKRYARTVSKAGNEATMVHLVSGHMLKEYDDDGYKKAFSRVFTAFPKEVGFNNDLPAPQPDFAEGLEMQEYDPFPVEEHVSGAVLYKDDPYSMTLPHLAGEWKNPDGSMAEVTLQSRYDGAALVYARNQALSLIGKPDPLTMQRSGPSPRTVPPSISTHITLWRPTTRLNTTSISMRR